MKLRDVRIEYQNELLNMVERYPRFSWKLEQTQDNTIQRAYRIRVTTGESVVWDTGVVENDHSILVPYAGTRLTEETQYRAVISVWDNHGNCAQEMIWFETGFFDPQHFCAQMIRHDFPEELEACPVFNRSFSVTGKIHHARLYITAQGIYEAMLNGNRIGEDYLTPGWTSYDSRLMYQVYDVTELLKEQNRIDVTVAHGWFNDSFGYSRERNFYGSRNGLFAQLNIYYEDGSVDIVATDETWSVTTGEIQSSSLYDGELINTYSPTIYNGKVVVDVFDKSILRLQENEPVRVTQRLSAKKLFKDTAGNMVLDFGQNLVGVTEIRYQGKPGQVITVRHAEILDKDGVFYTANLRSAKATDQYICDGTLQILRPHFTFHGFRYIAVEGMEDATADMFTACVMHSNMKRTADFHCSNEKVNQLYRNITWGQRGNFVDVPTDCPQRDERLGWTGDAQVFSWTAAIQYETARFFAKWMNDVSAESSLELGVPHVVPNFIRSYAATGWGDAAVIVPWVVYQTYGDTRILENCWQCMHEWVDFIHNHCNENGLWFTGYQFGDWLALDREAGPSHVGATDTGFVANAFYLYVTDLVRQTARILGFKDAEKQYSTLYEDTLTSFRSEFYTDRGRIVSETQTGCVLSLRFDLAREKDRRRIMESLVKNIEAHNIHITTGFLGTPYLCHVLSENGRHDLASAIFLREDYPSWLYAVNKGATTIWEHWNSIKEDGSFMDTAMNSFNHYSYGSIADWMFRKIGGINQLEPGYHKFKIRPMFVKGITEATASFDSPYGLIESAWSCKNGQIHIKVTVPANTSAELYLPEKDGILHLGSGTYEYVYATTTNLRIDKYTLENKMGEILALPGVEDMLRSVAPEAFENPAFNVAKGLKLSVVLNVAPEFRPMFEKIINWVNSRE